VHFLVILMSRIAFDRSTGDRNRHHFHPAILCPRVTRSGVA